MFAMQKFLRDYFEARPQLPRPVETALGYEVPAPWKFVIDHLLQRLRAESAENSRMKHHLEQARNSLQEMGTQSGQTVSTSWVLHWVESALPTAAADRRDSKSRQKRLNVQRGKPMMEGVENRRGLGNYTDGEVALGYRSGQSLDAKRRKS